MTADSCSRLEFWLLLPWLANGRLPQAERARIEEHVRDCESCTRELTAQRLMCQALTEPERVTYAPGPSFRKLMARIDGHQPVPRSARHTRRSRAVSHPAPVHAAWRPPGLAWAATFLLLAGFSGLAATAYRWSQPVYITHSDAPPAPRPDVLHIAFVPSLSIGEVEQLLRADGARMVEGPDGTGVFGVTPEAAARGPAARDTGTSLSALAARLRADPRVRWVEPVAGAAAALTAERPPEP